MPYPNVESLPDWVKKLPSTKQRQFMHVFNNAFSKCMKKGNKKSCESSAFAQATAVVKGKAKSLSEIALDTFAVEDTKKIMDMLDKFGPEYGIEEMRKELTGGIGTVENMGPMTDRVDPMKYTADGMLEEILLAEKHIKDYLSGDNPTLCKECMQDKHLPLIKALAKEGATLTEDNDMKDVFLGFATMSTDMIGLMNDVNKDSAKKIGDTLREIRKKLKVQLSVEEKHEVDYPNVGVLSNMAMNIGWVPDKGISGLTEETENVIPSDYRYWEIDDVEERIETRNKLSEAIYNGEICLSDDSVIKMPGDPPEIPYIREEKKTKPKTRTIWKYHQDGDRIEFEGTLLSYGAWNGYYYSPDVIDNFDATRIVGKPVRFEHINRNIGEYTSAYKTDDHSIYVKGWTDDPQTCALVRQGKVNGLSPRVLFKANTSRKTVESINDIEEGSIVKTPACKVCFINNVN